MHTVQRKRILIVDSRAETRANLERSLRIDYEVVSALDGEMALELLKQRQDYTAIVLSCRLFETSGYDVILRLRTLRLSPPIPIIAMGDPSDELKALSVGAVEFLLDPVDPELLRCRLRNLLSLLCVWNDFDRLTGLYSRERFMAEVSCLLRENRRQKYTMIYTNLERFRVFNDLYGQQTGDQILSGLAKILSDWCPAGGIVGRAGGDHFIACCPSERMVPEFLLQRMTELMEKMHVRRLFRLRLGFYEIEDPDAPVQQMIDRAQMALGMVKDSVSRFYAYYDETLRRELLEEQEIACAMEDALKEGQFHIYLQPIYSLTTGTPISAEALVRWIHPEKGVIPPSKFISFFEHNGFICKLDAYVWETVFHYLAEMKQMGYPEFPISANMSRMDLYNPNLCEELTALAASYGVEPSLFRIEVTESAYMDDPDQMLETIQKLNAAGFQVQMDDFGSGYSSLNMLMNIPVSTLKIDMDLIRNIGLSERSHSVVNGVIRIAKWLEMTVVAEGVENQTQLNYLRSIGCDRVQGYYYSKPLPIEEFHGLIANFTRDELVEPPHRFDHIDLNMVCKKIMDSSTLPGKLLGAVGLYEMAGDSVELLAVNDEYYRTMETTPEKLFSEADSAIGWSCQESQRDLFQAFARALETGERQDLVTGRYVTSTRLIYLSLSICYLGRKDNRYLYILCGKKVSQTDGRLLRGDSAGNELTVPPVHTAGHAHPRILIVDDNQVNRMMLKKMLGDSYEVLEAANGKEALHLLLECRERIDAILLDIIMPVMDGYEFLQYRQREDRLRRIPVLVLSQAESRKSEIRALELGANDFVRKPYEPAKLRYRLSELLAPPDRC